ncbi:hypothetical protein ABDK00_001050 [Niabella insulamsoli]|uniref:hypothetical protein n=1 Tax=Niabella insulamsoli TaxID=3144874 RepID=UPI0031FC57A3
MQIKNNILCIAFCVIGLKGIAQEPVANTVHLGLFTPVSTQGKYAKQISPSFSLQILQGVNFNNKGVAIGGLYHKLYGNNKGVMISGLLNKVSGSDKGVSIAGLYNAAANGRGLQIAGLHNQKSGNGFVQIAGLSNSSHFEILQIAGLVNINKTVHTQIAGLVNVATSVKGVQIAGLVNIADSSDHPIGLINIIKTGEQQIGVQVYDDASANIVLRTGGRKTYGIISIGVGNELKKTVFQMEAGMGYHIGLSEPFRINAEAVAISKTDFTFFKHTQSLRALLAYKINPAIEVVAGPALNTYKYADSKIFGDNYLWRKNDSESSFAITIGALAGVNINL